MTNSETKQISFAFFGTPYVARDTLTALIEAGYIPAVVVTSPNARKGRGLKETPCATREYAEPKKLPVLAPNRLDDGLLDSLQAYDCEYAIVVAYGKLMPQKTLDAFPRGLLNIHYSLLPKHRGAAPVEYSLLTGDDATGVTIQKMSLAMDAGDIIAQRTLPIDERETILELRPRLIRTGAELLIETLPLFLDGTASALPQDELRVTFAPKIPKDAGKLVLRDDPEKNWRTYRALCESPGTYFFASKEGKHIRMKIKDARFDNGTFLINRIVPEGKPEQDFSWLEQNGWCAE